MILRVLVDKILVNKDGTVKMIWKEFKGVAELESVNDGYKQCEAFL